VGLWLAGLAVAGTLLLVAGAEKNAAVARLRDHAVSVEMTVGGCRGLLGGSGSNPVGYSCWGSFTLGGRSHREGIPGDALLAPGAKLQMRTVPGDPGLVEFPRAVAAEHTSPARYVLPAVLFALLLASVVVLALRRRRQGQPALRSPLARPGRVGRLGEAVGGV
jgi:hypothetical protein